MEAAWRVGNGTGFSAHQALTQMPLPVPHFWGLSRGSPGPVEEPVGACRWGTWHHAWPGANAKAAFSGQVFVALGGSLDVCAGV